MITSALLSARIHALGISQRDFARLTGLQDRTIRRQVGGSDVSEKTLDALAYIESHTAAAIDAAIDAGHIDIPPISAREDMDGWPAGWWHVVAARAAAEADIDVTYRGLPSSNHAVRLGVDVAAITRGLRGVPGQGVGHVLRLRETVEQTGQWVATLETPEDLREAARRLAVATGGHAELVNGGVAAVVTLPRPRAHDA